MQNNFTFKTQIVLLTGILLSVIPAAADPIYGGPNLLINGGFEGMSGTYAQVHGGGIAGWSATGAGVEWVAPVGYAGYNAGPAAQGLDIVDLAYVSASYGGIQQTFATVAGQSYQLSFAASNWGGSAGINHSDVGVNLNGVLLGINSVGAVPWVPGTLQLAPWQTFTYTFTATGSTTTMELFNNQNARYINSFVDNAMVLAATGDDSVTAVPEPGSLMLFGVGLIGFVAVTRRKRLE